MIITSVLGSAGGGGDVGQFFDLRTKSPIFDPGTESLFCPALVAMGKGKGEGEGGGGRG